MLDVDPTHAFDFLRLKIKRVDFREICLIDNAFILGSLRLRRLARRLGAMEDAQRAVIALLRAEARATGTCEVCTPEATMSEDNDSNNKNKSGGDAANSNDKEKENKKDSGGESVLEVILAHLNKAEEHAKGNEAKIEDLKKQLEAAREAKDTKVTIPAAEDVQ